MPRILIAERAPLVAAGLEHGLTAAGFRTTTAGCPASASTLLASGGFGLLLLDLGFPDVEAWRLLEDARARHVPVIVLSERADVRCVVLALEGGAEDFLSRPIRIDELAARIRRTLCPGRDHSTTSRGVPSLQ